MYHKLFTSSKGVALIAVLLIVLAVSALALLTLRLSQLDDRMVDAFGQNRRAQRVAEISGYVATSRAESHARITAFPMKLNCVENVNVSGLNSVSPGVAAGKYLGDLAHPVAICTETLNDVSQNAAPVPGYSSRDLYCSFLVGVESFGEVGNVPVIRNNAYVLNDLNTVVGFKRNMGAIILEPLRCDAFNNLGELPEGVDGSP